MVFKAWTTWLSARTRAKRPENRVRLNVEPLEDRWVASGSPTVNLTTGGAFGTINGAIFRQLSQQPSGSGVFDSFVRLQARGNATIEQGYNTDARPLQFDENNSPVFTRALPLPAVPVVNIDGVAFRQFSLDINQSSSEPLLSLDELRLFTASQGNLTGYDATTNTLPGANLVYDMGGNSLGTGNWVELNARLSHGSGSSDAVVYVPDALFKGGSYVYLYSTFGVNQACNGGYEEWATAPPVPFSQQTFTISGAVTDLGSPNTSYTVTLIDTTLGITQNVTFSSTSTYSFGGLIAGDNYTLTVTSGGNTVTATSPGHTGSSYIFNDLSMNEVANFTIGSSIVMPPA